MEKAKPKPQYGIKSVAIGGHYMCRGKNTFSRVPKEMGWLWTARNVPGLKFDPSWRPGAVPKSLFKGRKIKHPHHVVESIKFKKSNNSKKSVRPDIEESEESDERFENTLVLQKNNGQIEVILKQFQVKENRHVSEYPYDDKVLPYTFKVQNETQEDKKLLKIRDKVLMRRNVFKDAFMNIYREVYDNIDKEMLRKAASCNEVCPCVFLEQQIISKLVQVYMDEHLGKGNAAQCESSLMSSLEALGGAPLAAVRSEEWRLEFTPPAAQYKPSAKQLLMRDTEVQTVRLASEKDKLLSSSSVVGSLDLPTTT